MTNYYSVYQLGRFEARGKRGMYSREGASGREAQGRGRRQWRDADVEVRQTRDAPRAHSLGSGSPRPNVKTFQSMSLNYVLIQFVSFRSNVPTSLFSDIFPI